MRAFFYDGERARSGLNRNTSMIYAARKGGTVTILRRHVKPVGITEHQKKVSTKFKAALTLWPEVSEEFKNDLKVYAKLYNRQLSKAKQLEVSGYNIYLSVVCKLPVIAEELSDITIVVGNTLQSWIDRGHLAPVKTSYTFTAQM